MIEYKEESGLSAQVASDTHVCKECVFFRPAKQTEVCGGYTITMMAYCALMKTEFCMWKPCKQYEQGDT